MKEAGFRLILWKMAKTFEENAVIMTAISKLPVMAKFKLQMTRGLRLIIQQRAGVYSAHRRARIQTIILRMHLIQRLDGAG